MIAAALDPSALERAVMPHHHRRRIVEPLDQQAGLVPDRNRQRTERARHALPAQPILGRGEQRAGAILILGLEQPPIAGAGRSEERRVGNEWVSPCRSRWAQYLSNKNNRKHNTQN